VSWGDIEHVTIIEGREVYDAAVKDFNCIWDNVAQPLE